MQHILQVGYHIMQPASSLYLASDGSVLPARQVHSKEAEHADPWGGAGVHVIYIHIQNTGIRVNMNMMCILQSIACSLDTC